jgi:hypothetical protein
MWISKQNVIGRYAALAGLAGLTGALEKRIVHRNRAKSGAFLKTRQAILVRCTILDRDVVSLHRKKYCEPTFTPVFSIPKQVFALNMDSAVPC